MRHFIEIVENAQQWGVGSGTHTAYRAGPLESSPRGIFFADSHDGAWIYGQSSGYPVETYEVTVNKVWVLPNQFAFYGGQHGMTVEEVRAMKRGTYWLRDLDVKIAKLSRKRGFDAIIYTEPTTPTCEGELVIFNPIQAKLLPSKIG